MIFLYYPNEWIHQQIRCLFLLLSGHKEALPSPGTVISSSGYGWISTHTAITHSEWNPSFQNLWLSRESFLSSITSQEYFGIIYGDFNLASDVVVERAGFFVIDRRRFVRHVDEWICPCVKECVVLEMDWKEICLLSAFGWEWPSRWNKGSLCISEWPSQRLIHACWCEQSTSSDY